jgi:hypothetical protein
MKRAQKHRTAVIVVHGIGEQSPFETLDAFAANFIRSLGPVTLSHAMAERKGAGGSAWQDNFVRIEKEKNNPIDIHEFYWAYITEGKISIPEVTAWVEQTLEGTKKFYREDVTLQDAYENRKHTKRFPLANVLWLLRLAAIALPFIKIAQFIFAPVLHLPFFTWLSKMSHAVLDKFGWVVTGYLGDVAVYTTTDEKSKYYRIRQQILNECQAMVEEILNDPVYDRVIIAGHSLGSVIAYDTLNRINIKANVKEGDKLPVGKLAGLITFGSPLDKIAFFFRTHTGKNEYIRRQILAHLHSFKAKPLSFENDPVQLSNPIIPKLDAVPWVNYYAQNDPVSGHLDFYKIKEQDNVMLTLPQSWGVAHTGYWTSSDFYQDIIKRFGI